MQACSVELDMMRICAGINSISTEKTSERFYGLILGAPFFLKAHGGDMKNADDLQG